MLPSDSKRSGLLGLSKGWWAHACALLALVGWASAAQATVLVIDDFTQPTAQFFVVGSGINPQKEITQFSAGAIGGQRDTLVSVVGAAQPNSVVGLIGHDTTYLLNALQIGTNGRAPTVVSLQYSGLDTLNTAVALVNAHALSSGLGVDLTNGHTNDQFLVRFMGSDAQPTAGLDMSITITSPGGKSSTVMTTVPNSLATFDVLIPFIGLVGNATTTHVDSITVVFNGLRKSPNVDYQVQLLGTTSTPNIPEPASGTLLAIAGGLLALAMRRANRRQALRTRGNVY